MFIWRIQYTLMRLGGNPMPVLLIRGWVNAERDPKITLEMCSENLGQDADRMELRHRLGHQLLHLDVLVFQRL
jgi:hypothetical protein